MAKVDIYNTDKKYNIIYADPPWQYKVWSEATGQGRSAESHYKTMQKEDIQNLPIPNICEKDCILFLWVTAPCLIEGLELITKWGFQYKTFGFTWIKQNKKSNSLFWGMGYYTRANTELCVLATKGKPLKRMSKSVHQVITSKIREHSRKPDEARERIVQLFGDIPRIELFARQQVGRLGLLGERSMMNKELGLEKDIKMLEAFKNQTILYGKLAITREAYASISKAIENLLKRYKELEAVNTMQEYRINEMDIPKSKIKNLITQIENAIDFMKTDKSKIKVNRNKQKEEDLRLEIKHLQELLEDKYDRGRKESNR